MKRYGVVNLVGTGAGDDPYRPDVPAAATGWALVGVRGGKCLVKVVLPDGTAATANTIADVQAPDPSPADGADDADVHLTGATLTATQRTNILTFLTNNGVDVGDWPAPTTRRALFRWIVTRFPGLAARAAIHGYDVAG